MVLEITNNDSGKLPFGNIRGTDRIIQNVINIMNTYKYEVAYNRGFGISPDIIDKDIETMSAMVIEDLFDSIKTNEPRAKLISVDIQNIATDGHITATVRIEV